MMSDPAHVALARRIAGAPKAPTTFKAPLSPRFTRGLVSGYNADGTLLISVDGSPSAIDADALNGIAPPLGATVELHTFGQRLVVDGVVNGNPYMVTKVQRSTSLTATSGSATKMAWDSTPVEDDGNCWNSANQRFICASPGRYRVTVRLSVTSGATNRLYCSIYKNGSEAWRGTDIANNNIGPCGSFAEHEVGMVQGDYVEAWYYTVDANPFENGSAECWMHITKVSG